QERLASDLSAVVGSPGRCSLERLTDPVLVALHPGTACPCWASISNTLHVPPRILKTGFQSWPVLSMAKRVACGEEAAFERHHPSPNIRTPEIDCCGAQQGRAVTTAVRWLFTCGSEYATTNVAMTSFEGLYAGYVRLTRYEAGILPAAVQYT